MAATNDVTGDRISTGSSSDNYRDNYDAIFGKKDSVNGSKQKEEEAKDADNSESH